MLKMEDSGIDSDARSNSNGATQSTHNSSNIHFPTVNAETHYAVKFSGEEESAEIVGEKDWDTPEASHVQSEGVYSPSSQLMTTSKLQKRLEKQILQARKIRQKEQNFSTDVPKKLISRNRLKVPKCHQAPVVTKSDSYPLVSWESESEDDEFDFHPMSKKSSREITQQLIKDGYNLDLTPDDEDLDLIPPKSFNKRYCTCCNSDFMCHIQ